MQDKELLNKTSEFLKKVGYTHISFSPIIKRLEWSFDIIAENNKEMVAIEYRRNDTILDVFIQRINKIRDYPKKLKIFFLFEKAPRPSTLTLLKKHKIGILLIDNGKVYYLLDSKDFSKKHQKKKEVIKEQKSSKVKYMHQIIVYPSSKQYESDGKTICKERDIICKVVRRYQRKGIPIKCTLVEDDPRGGKNFRKKILINLKETHIFIAAVNIKYSDYVNFEIKKVFDFIPDENLIHILKKNMSNDEIENDEVDIRKRDYKRKKQLELISFVQSKTQHFPYSGLKDFESKVDDALVKMIDLLHKRNGSKSPFSF